MANKVKDLYLKIWKKSKATYGIKEDNSIEENRGGTELRKSMLYDMDVMQLMGFKDEYKIALSLVQKNDISLSEGEVSVFEATTKGLATLLGSYEMGGRTDASLLAMAKKLGNRLLLAWKDTGLFPKSLINLKTGEGRYHDWNKGHVLLSEVGALQLEFAALSEYSKDSTYVDQVKYIHFKLSELAKANEGLYIKFIDPAREKFQTKGEVTIGSMADSFFQALLKNWILSGYKDMNSLRQFVEAVDAINGKLIQHIKAKDLVPRRHTFTADYQRGRVSRVMEEFACFYPGLLAEAVIHSDLLSSKPGFSPQAPEVKLLEKKSRFLVLSRQLMDACYQLHKQSPDGLAPEAIKYTPNSWETFRAHDEHRPETIMSLYYMAMVTTEVTEKERYKNMGKEIFESMLKAEAAAEAEGKESKMLVQTLRYAYLLFSEDKIIDHSKIVLSTEGHPIGIKEVI